MKIYTEVNYIWKDDKLVQTDSKSFDYEGDVEQCHKRWNWHTHASINQIIPSGGSTADATTAITTGLKTGTTALKKGWDKIRKDNPNPNLNIQTPDQLYNKARDMAHDAATNIKRIWDRNRPQSELPNPNNYITTTDSPLLEESLEPGSRATAGGGKYGASGRSTAGRRGIEKKHATSLINQHMQKRLPA